MIEKDDFRKCLHWLNGGNPADYVFKVYLMSVQIDSDFLSFKIFKALMVSVVEAVLQKLIMEKCLRNKEEDVNATHLIGEVHKI